MRFVPFVLSLAVSPPAFGPVALVTLVACESSSTPPAPDASGVIVPTADGAECACATPDCLPNCKALPACWLVCTSEGTITWNDACGNIQYVQSCANGCTDASTPTCQ